MSTATAKTTSRRPVIDFELRYRIEKAIERLIAVLDAVDPDPDLEPSLGHYNSRFTAPDAEAEDEHDEDGGDEEPSLGWSEYRDDGLPSQSGGTDDLEF